MADEKELIDFVSKLSGVETQLAVLGSEVKSGFAAIESKLRVIFNGDSKKCVEQDGKINALDLRVTAIEKTHTDESTCKKDDSKWLLKLVAAFAIIEFLKWVLTKLFGV